MSVPTQPVADEPELMKVLGVDDLDGVRQFCAGNKFCWMDLENPDPDTVARVGEALELHPLAIEDTQEFDQRPKVDGRGDRLLLVYYGARLGESGTVELVEVHVHVQGRFVLTVHRDPCPSLIRLHAAASGDPPESEPMLIYRLLDTLTDSLLDVLDQVAATASDREAKVFRRPRASDRDEIALVRRSLDTSRRLILTERQVFDRMIERTDQLAALSSDLRPQYADISDHLWRAVDDMESARESLHGMIDQYSNAVQERLTIVATVFLPLTFLTGFFGQNFSWMTNHLGSAATFWGLGVGGLIASVLVIRFWLVRSGMLDRSRRGR